VRTALSGIVIAPPRPDVSTNIDDAVPDSTDGAVDQHAEYIVRWDAGRDAVLTHGYDWRANVTAGRLRDGNAARSTAQRLSSACTIVPLKPNEFTPTESVLADSGTEHVGNAINADRTPSRSRISGFSTRK
jgi:hypothetical protein